MTFNLLSVDFFWSDRLFGFSLASVHTENNGRGLFIIYWNDGDLLIDLLWFRVYTGFPFNSED